MLMYHIGILWNTLQHAISTGGEKKTMITLLSAILIFVQKICEKKDSFFNLLFNGGCIAMTLASSGETIIPPFHHTFKAFKIHNHNVHFE